MTTIRHVARQRMKECTYQSDAMWALKVDITNSVEEKESVNRMVKKLSDRNESARCLYHLGICNCVYEGLGGSSLRSLRAWFQEPY